MNVLGKPSRDNMCGFVTTTAYEKLKAENAKLRELVRQMYPGAKAFLQLGMQLGCNDTLSYDWWLQLRELGIEECAYEYS